jgi:putative Mg2+ transporter-C (MgtC) family protein
MQMNEMTEMILRLVLAGFLGSLIGLERDFRGKAAGTRTYLLVSLGSALMMIVSKYAFAAEGGDPGRVAAQIVSGIGFIGAGAIMFDRQSVHGLTTAAGIWVVAGIGMASAAGMYTISIVTTLLALIGLEIGGWPFFRRKTNEPNKSDECQLPPKSQVER